MASRGIHPRRHQGRPASPAGQQRHPDPKFETDLIIEGIRPGRVVRVRPGTLGNWPQVQVPREEYLGDWSLEERFPTPAIFPKY
jgi:hypothetical protein